MSEQHLQKRAKFLTSEGNIALLLASARNQTGTKGGMILMRLMFTSSTRRVFQTVFFFHDKVTDPLMTDPSRNSEFCFPRASHYVFNIYTDAHFD